MLLDEIHDIMLPHMVLGLEANALAGGRLVNILVLVLHGFYFLDEVSYVPFDMDHIFSLERSLVQLHHRNTEMAIVMRYHTDGFF